MWFETGEGPRLAPTLKDHALGDLTPMPQRLTPIFETVRKVRLGLPDTVTLLGFAGSPWTVATYMVAGQGSKDQGDARRMAYNDPERFAELIDAITSATIDYLSGQIQAGADAVQLFDSWAGSLAPAQFDRWVIEPTRTIVAALNERHPETPIIGFPKGAGGKLPAYAIQTGVDAVGVDESVDPEWANQHLPVGMPVQGNLDPLVLIAGGISLEVAVERILTAFAGRPHVFNLGHGILPDTPIEHVEKVLNLVRNNA